MTNRGYSEISFSTCSPGSLYYILYTLAILNYPPHFVSDSFGVKCELRDVSHTFPEAELSYFTRSNETLDHPSFQTDLLYDVQILTC